MENQSPPNLPTLEDSMDIDQVNLRVENTLCQIGFVDLESTQSYGPNYRRSLIRLATVYRILTRTNCSELWIESWITCER